MCPDVRQGSILGYMRVCLAESIHERRGIRAATAESREEAGRPLTCTQPSVHVSGGEKGRHQTREMSRGSDLQLVTSHPESGIYALWKHEPLQDLWFFPFVKLRL